jgi:hypothetical protein
LDPQQTVFRGLFDHTILQILIASINEKLPDRVREVPRG